MNKKLIKKIVGFFSPLTSTKWITGRENKIITNYFPIIWNCRIKIWGSRNRIEIGEGAMIKNVMFYIRGNETVINIGKNVRISGGEIWIEDDHSEIRISDNTTIESAHLAAIEGKKIILGEDCMLANDIDIRTGDSHSILSKDERINPANDVVIGNHVWIGAHVSILRDVKIGNNSIIGTRALVTSGAYPEGVILGGIPSRVLKEDVSWDRQRI
jgi:acetyltransferase-like isoleucine patch superfamily enzyme